MATRMRLQRFGKKGQPFYHVVIADGRAPRDGRFIEKLGTYNPLTRPADIKLDFDRTLYWLQKGASPSPTVKAILKYEGIAYMHHLLKGVSKGALTEAQAKARFEEWRSNKDAKISSAKNDYRNDAKNEAKKRLEAEAKVNEVKAEKLAKKRAEAAKKEAAENEEVSEVEATEEVAAEATVEETPEVKVEEAPEEKVEEPEATVEETPEADTTAETPEEKPAE